MEDVNTFEGRVVAADLEEPMVRLKGAMDRGAARRAPFVKVRTEDLAALFEAVRLGAVVAKKLSDLQAMPVHKRIIHTLREA